MIASGTKRPRNVDWKRAAAILYGDWGTSKAYVIGLAFMVAGYSSFWLIGAMCILTGLVGVNYMAICKHYPDGGGVYASVRHRSEIISIVGAFLLIADYIVTAALSALSAFLYLGVSHPEYWAGAAIVLIGALNVFGPKHSGGLAFLISVPTAIVVVLLGAFCLPHIGEAISVIKAHPMHGGWHGLKESWVGFVSVVLALSGVEAIANSTGVMKLNPGSTDDKPCVSKTANKAIIIVMIEVCFLTALLGLGMHALPGLAQVPSADGGEVNGPGAEGVRDYMLRYMADIFVGHATGGAHFSLLGHVITVGQVAGGAVSIVFGFLLLSAVNTAIVDLIAISFLMGRDGELPPVFYKLNKFGVPNAGLFVATIIPFVLVLVVKDMSGLADLYAVGVVGAIATNLGASSTDKHLGLEKWERSLMFFTFLVMLSIEITLFATKPNARLFSLVILVLGLIGRGLASEFAQRKKRDGDAAATAVAAGLQPVRPGMNLFSMDSGAASGPPILAAVRGIGRTLDFAIEEARESNRPLYLLFVREQPVLAAGDRKRKWHDDPEALKIFSYAADKADGHTVLPCYAVSDSPADTIVDIAATVGASRLLLGSPQRNSLINMLRGNLIRKVSDLLPEEIHMLVYA
jgi:amino acid transporter/nucleotide-binding universal stress UspA family protein